ncbi:glycosyltransferase family 2 protein [Echinicola shivajiensis]|uniref:glycosyltransferase family 2 protein n=1 Tax=Echinicola shivajiensis TaxID=1035916 RepID=UPI001BFCA7E3|nr:glycosyltransferase family 2 protein [Echinicola shivajiensis]
MTTPLVSVIIPIYNKVKFVTACLKSVEQQTYTNLEIIIIDDGSNDGSRDLINKFAETTSRKVFVFRQKNNGACHARNLGIEKCKGKYIQFLDADDLLDSKKIESQVRELEKEGEAVLAFGQWTYFNIAIGDLGDQYLSIYKNYESPKSLLIEMWSKQFMIAPFSWLTRKSLVNKVGEWDESLKINQDGEYFARVIDASNKIIYTPAAKGYYRKPTSNNISTKKNKATAYSLYKTFTLYEELVEDLKGYDATVIALLKNYEHYIYRMNQVAPELCEKAFLRIKKLKGNKFPYTASQSKLLFLAQFIGLGTALKLKAIFS